MPRDSETLARADSNVKEAVARGFIEFRDSRVHYNLKDKKSYNWADPEEWVRVRAVAALILRGGYPANRIRLEVTVPRRTPSDHADIVVFEDDRCSVPYLIVEAKAANQTAASRNQGIEQLFGNCNSLRAPLGLYEEWSDSILFDVARHPATERTRNRLGSRDAVPAQYGQIPTYMYVAGTANDIVVRPSSTIENQVRRSHSIIWAGGKRDPLLSFDEWSKLLFAKVVDERTTPTGQPRRFQVGAGETVAAVATRVHELFAQGARDDPTIFPPGTRITLPDKKIFDVVEVLQGTSLLQTEVDNIGAAFENFFGSIFRGELGQYFTMRPLARFVVSMLDIRHTDFVIDPTAGSGGFLLEALLQVWHRADRDFAGQPANQVQRMKEDFALLRVFGIEIHEILARICKINLLLHHDGHTNIEADRSCLDSTFNNYRLRNWRGQFSRIIGNPPFGDEVKESDEDILGSNNLEAFVLAENRDKIASEQVILERCVDMLQPGGRLGLILPDGLFNNQGTQSNCPAVRSFLARNGQVEAIVSLPDFAFRKSGAQNKTSVLFFRRFTAQERAEFDVTYAQEEAQMEADARLAAEAGLGMVRPEEEEIISAVYKQGRFAAMRIFFAEANQIGYTTTGGHTKRNDLYRGVSGGQLDTNEADTILGEWQAFVRNPAQYQNRVAPDCMSLTFAEAWDAHQSHRLDPKYHLFKFSEAAHLPPGWVQRTVSTIMRKREVEVFPGTEPDRQFHLLTVSQTGEIKGRVPGKGNNPPEWLGMYLEDMPSRWFEARAGDVVFSSIDLWKGCIAVVPPEFDRAIVTKEFPVYEVVADDLDAEFLSVLLRSRYYQRAFRAITTGHSNRRRTQEPDFESLEVCYPPDVQEQQRLIANIRQARAGIRTSIGTLHQEMLAFSDLIDGRSQEELPEVEPSDPPED